MKRVMIVGAPGSGKSTLARQLGVRTGLPVHHMDRIHYRSGWQERSLVEKQAMTRKVHALDAWIFEGGFSATWPERLRRADTLVWLDFPVGIRLWRVARRTVRYLGRSRSDLPDGCNETIGVRTFQFVRSIWRTRKSSRMKLQRSTDSAPAQLRVFRLGSRKAVLLFIEKFDPISSGSEGRLER